MAVAISIAALIVAVVACVIGGKGWRRSQRLALEMVQLRDRLTRAERGYRHAADAAATADPGRPVPDAAWAPRVAELEGRLRAALERDETSEGDADTPEPDARRTIRQHLKREGYERIAILDEAPDGSVVLEAERAGVTTKGRAEILEDGSVRLRAISSVRAFP